jgi:hypothetical protein
MTPPNIAIYFDISRDGDLKARILKVGTRLYGPHAKPNYSDFARRLLLERLEELEFEDPPQKPGRRKASGE